MILYDASLAYEKLTPLRELPIWRLILYIKSFALSNNVLYFLFLRSNIQCCSWRCKRVLCQGTKFNRDNDSGKSNFKGIAKDIFQTTLLKINKFAIFLTGKKTITTNKLMKDKTQKKTAIYLSTIWGNTTIKNEIKCKPQF